MDVNLFHFESDAPFWTLLGVLIGGGLSGIINYYLQKSQFKHNKEMFYLQNQGKENIKELLEDYLNHRTHTARSFNFLRGKIGGIKDEDLRFLLHEVKAKRTKNRKGDEMWYLIDREKEWFSKMIKK